MAHRPRSFPIAVDGTTGRTPLPTGPARLVPSLVAGLILTVVVGSAVVMFGDLRSLRTALDGFTWWLIWPALGLTLWNYVIRFFKWQLYLKRLDIGGLSPRVGALVYLSAFALSITPGKVGEMIKCGFLLRLTGTPIARSSAAVVAERLTDGLAMLVLAACGAVQFAAGRSILGIAALVALAALLLLQRPDRFRALLDHIPPLPVLGRVARHADAFFEASGTLVRPSLLLAGTGLGVVAWLGECLAFFLILIGLGLPPTGQLFLIATFVLAVSSLAGALSMLPGGLGVAEASVAAMLLLLVRTPAMDSGTALAATLLIRFATLWFAVLLGIGALVILRRGIARSTIVPAIGVAPPPPVLGNPVAGTGNDIPTGRSSGGNP